MNWDPDAAPYRELFVRLRKQQAGPPPQPPKLA